MIEVEEVVKPDAPIFWMPRGLCGDCAALPEYEDTVEVGYILDDWTFAPTCCFECQEELVV